MSLFAIGDLHLSFDQSVDKPMDIYGGQWVDHARRVKEHWERIVTDQDTVIISGDISWGLKLSEAMADLDWIDHLPGKKVLIKGNHDLWWSSLSKLSRISQGLFFIQNQCYEGTDFVICGSRGWICPGETGFSVQDYKIYERELGRLRLSLEAGKRTMEARDKQGKGLNLIGALHFPPTNERLESSGFTELFEQYGVSKVVYGHLHGTEGFKNGIQGQRNGIEYHLVSCDKLACCPMKLLDV